MSVTALDDLTLWSAVTRHRFIPRCALAERGESGDKSPHSKELNCSLLKNNFPTNNSQLHITIAIQCD